MSTRKPAVMPRFPEESVACLRRVMLSRASQDFKFTPSDVDMICTETGLNQGQVQVWADHFRFRSSFKKLDDILDNLRGKKVT